LQVNKGEDMNKITLQEVTRITDVLNYIADTFNHPNILDKVFSLEYKKLGERGTSTITIDKNIIENAITAYKNKLEFDLRDLLNEEVI